tara:strand:- start:569 stop:832 length:264 start_codon:yes stop_codon:yes gene_type:complete
MRQIRTFNLAKHVVDDMNAQIRRGYRSQFVEEAINDKLQKKAEFNLDDFKIVELLGHIELFRFSSLTKLERLFIRELMDRLRKDGEV